LGSNVYRFEYVVTGHQFLANQELAIEFDPDVYLALSNATGPAEFDILLFQPDDPPGTVGRFSALALVDIAALSGFFSLDVHLDPGMSGMGPSFPWSPGLQLFSISQLDEQGTIISGIAEGSVSFTPETSTWQLSAIGLLVVFVYPALRRVITSG
jgi:hypothetical protein